MSLKQKLFNFIQLNKSMSTWELYEISKQEGVKVSNSERRLRELMNEDPNIKADKNERGVITGYYYESQITSKGEWCKYCGGWMNHLPQCITQMKKQEPKKVTLF